MNIDNVPKEVIEWVKEDIELDMSVESGYSANSRLYVAHSDYFTVVPEVITSTGKRTGNYWYMYTDKAKALYYFLKL